MLKKYILVLVLSINIVLVVGSSYANVDYTLWDRVLKTYVDNKGLVDYRGLKNNDVDLKQFIEIIENTNVDELDKEEQKSFWINVYNALTMNLILDKYPLKIGGIRTINWGRPWDITMKVGMKALTLGDIEHKILRKWVPLDERIHFAINCASLSCPKLLQSPFYPKNLDEQLEQEAKRFILDQQNVYLDKKGGTLYYSAILKWFEDDFTIDHGSILDYISGYLNQEDQSYLNNHGVKLKVFKYNWGLNKQ